MDAQRIDNAFTRIEAALERIETAAAAPRPGSEGGWNTYRKLKTRIGGTVAELDQLIAELDR